MKIVLGSTSEEKKKILKEALEKLGIKSQIVGVSVDSGIADQPIGEKTTIKGAINRALEGFRKLPEADLFVGLEGGIEKIRPEQYFLVCAAAIADKEGHLYLGVGSKLALPHEVCLRVEKGEQFGIVIREYEKKHSTDPKLKPLIEALISRKRSFLEAIENAYLAYLNRKHFFRKN